MRVLTMCACGVGPNWPQYTADNQVLLQLASSNMTTIPDDYRAEQIAYLNSVSSLFGQ